MHCTHCNYSPEDPEARFCSQCGFPLERQDICQCCGKQLPPGARFCDHCGAALDNNTGIFIPYWYRQLTQTQAGERQIDPTLFICSACGENYPINQQVGATGICSSCTAGNQAPPETDLMDHQGRIRPATNSHYPGSNDDFYHSRLVKLGVDESQWVEIPAGEYLMGSPEDEKDRFENEHQHQVEIGNFFLLRNPVTFAMFDLFCDELKLPRPPDEGWGRELRPVINVTYWSVMEYCIWLQKRTGWNIRLPTETEWEYACRAGTTTPFSTGETITPEQANYDGNYTYRGSPRGERVGMTTPVMSYPPNPWGLYDMHGNVWEWCASVYDEEYQGLEQLDAGSDRDDLRERVVRGGSWYNVPGGLRSASRNKMGPNYHYLRIGFRIVREVATNTE